LCLKFHYAEAKCVPGGSRQALPAALKPNVYEEVRRLALRTHVALGYRGSRADFRYDDRMEGTQGLGFLVEVNARHGMTDRSFAPALAVHAGTFEELVTWMVEDPTLDH
jgi:D-alanine-D-alanine ligase